MFIKGISWYLGLKSKKQNKTKPKMHALIYSPVPVMFCSPEQILDNFGGYSLGAFGFDSPWCAHYGDATYIVMSLCARGCPVIMPRSSCAASPLIAGLVNL